MRLTLSALGVLLSLLLIAALDIGVAGKLPGAAGEAAAQAQCTRFAVIGDYGDAGEPEADVAALVKSWNPEFIITTGDNNYPSGAAETIDENIGQYYHEFISLPGTYGEGADTNRFFLSCNHDWQAWAQPYMTTSRSLTSA